jgi:hypothetical protein
MPFPLSYDVKVVAFVLSTCNKIDSSITVFSEKAILLGETGSVPYSNLTIGTLLQNLQHGKNGTRISSEKDKMVACLDYFRYHVYVYVYVYVIQLTPHWDFSVADYIKCYAY